MRGGLRIESHCACPRVSILDRVDAVVRLQGDLITWQSFRGSAVKGKSKVEAMKKVGRP